MTIRLAPTIDTEEAPDTGDTGLGAMRTDRGNLPLESIDAAVRITGLVGRIELTQGFQNPHDVPLEATYVFPLPDRSAVTAMRMTADGRVVEAELKERGQAREEYDQAIAEGKRASIAEEERPDVFTMRVGNILPGERVSVALTLVGPLSYEDGEATFRLPLVVAPRYIPGAALDGVPVGDGYAVDTDATPDASRITPPVLLPGFPHPVRLSIGVDIDAAGLPLGDVRSSLHAVVAEGNRLSIQPGERANRDFVLRLAYGQPDSASHSLTLTPDAGGDEGTFRLTVLPPTAAGPPRPRDVVLLLDRSGSMQGWKMVAARRAAARIVDTLTAGDRFAVLAFDHAVERPPTLPGGLVEATDRHRYRAVEHLARMDARGGTELLAPLTTALSLLKDGKDPKGGGARDRVLVLVTDGQVGNEDQILSRTAASLTGVRVHTVGIDQAVNAGFLGRLAAAGGGRCELVESEDRLDDAMDRIHRRIGAPVVAGLTLAEEGLTLVDGTVSPARLPDLFPGAPLVVTGRYQGAAEGAMRLTGREREGSEWSARVEGVAAAEPSLTAVWARANLRDLEDRYVTSQTGELEQRITSTSLRFGVLCRFTAWLAVDSRVAADGSPAHRVIQPVESPAGWETHPSVVPAAPMRLMAGMAGMPAPPRLSASLRATYGPSGGSARPARGFSAGEPRPSTVDPLAQARAQAAEEVARLRAAQGAAEYERRELLADVGTRLAALAKHHSGLAELVPVQELAVDLDADRPLRVPADVFEDLWARTLRVLDTLAGRSQGRKAFWKKS